MEPWYSNPYLPAERHGHIPKKPHLVALVFQLTSRNCVSTDSLHQHTCKLVLIQENRNGLIKNLTQRVKTFQTPNISELTNKIAFKRKKIIDLTCSTGFKRLTTGAFSSPHSPGKSVLIFSIGQYLPQTFLLLWAERLYLPHD